MLILLHNSVTKALKNCSRWKEMLFNFYPLQKRWIFLGWCRRGISWLDIVNSSYMEFWSSERLQTFSNTTIRCVCVCRLGWFLCVCMCNFMSVCVCLVLQRVWWHHQRDPQQIQDNQLSGKCQNCVFVSAAGLWETSNSKCVLMMIQTQEYRRVCVCVGLLWVGSGPSWWGD